MSLVQSARMNGHEPWAYLRNVLQRLPTLRNSQLDELLPHRWKPAQACAHDCRQCGTARRSRGDSNARDRSSTRGADHAVV
ncbi:MAG: transposase domain-containing protein [Aquincola tertiaricarbonis]